MAEHEKQTTIDYDGHQNPSAGWLGLVVGVVLVVMFLLLYGTISMFANIGASLTHKTASVADSSQL